VLAPGAIRARFEVMHAIPAATWLMGDIYRVTAPGRFEDGDFPAFLESGTRVLPGVIEHANPVDVLLKSARVPQVGTAMIRRDVIERVGGFDDTLRYSEDWLFWLTIGLTEPLYWLQTPTVHLRRYNESMTKNRLADAGAGPLAPTRALGDPRFAAWRKPLRWRLAQEWRRYSSTNLDHGRRVQAAAGALNALRWVPNDVRNFNALRAALSPRSAR